MPPGSPRPSSGSGRAVWARAVVVVVAVLAVVAVGAAMRRRTPREGAPPDSTGAAGDHGAKDARPARASSDPRSAVRQASAVVSCGPRTGRAVFLGPERAVASVACDPRDAAQFRLADGRELLGKPTGKAPTGLSSFVVLGASATPLALGEAATLGEGAALLALVAGEDADTLVPVRSEGLSSAWGEPALLLAAAGAPFAGPVVDGGGRLVALVPQEPLDPGRPGLAVPAEALSADRPPAGPGDAWRTAVERAAAADRREADEFGAHYRSPALVAAWAEGDRLGVGVALRRARRPAAVRVQVNVEPAPQGSPCVANGVVASWAPAAGGRAPWMPAAAASRLRWAADRGVAGDLWIGRGALEWRCAIGLVPVGARLAIAGDGPQEAVAFPKAEFEAASNAAGAGAGAESAPAPAAGVRQVDEAEEAQARAAREAETVEASWRVAFRETHERIRDAEERRRALVREADDAEGHLQYAQAERLRQRAAAVAAELREAEDALHELERQASLAGVPRAWRGP